MTMGGWLALADKSMRIVSIRNSLINIKRHRHAPRGMNRTGQHAATESTFNPPFLLIASLDNHPVLRGEMPGAFAKTLSYGIFGVDAYQVQVEIDVMIG